MRYSIVRTALMRCSYHTTTKLTTKVEQLSLQDSILETLMLLPNQTGTIAQICAVVQKKHATVGNWLNYHTPRLAKMGTRIEKISSSETNEKLFRLTMLAGTAMEDLQETPAQIVQQPQPQPQPQPVAYKAARLTALQEELASLQAANALKVEQESAQPNSHIVWTQEEETVVADQVVKMGGRIGKRGLAPLIVKAAKKVLPPNRQRKSVQASVMSRSLTEAIRERQYPREAVAAKQVPELTTALVEVPVTPSEHAVLEIPTMMLFMELGRRMEAMQAKLLGNHTTPAVNGNSAKEQPRIKAARILIVGMEGYAEKSLLDDAKVRNHLAADNIDLRFHGHKRNAGRDLLNAAGGCDVVLLNKTTPHSTSHTCKCRCKDVRMTTGTKHMIDLIIAEGLKIINRREAALL